MHVALAKDLAPYRAAAHVAGSIAEPGLATLNDMITGQAAFVGVIDQFEVMMIAMLIVSPLVLFLRKPRPAKLTRSESMTSSRRGSLCEDRLLLCGIFSRPDLARSPPWLWEADTRSCRDQTSD